MSTKSAVVKISVFLVIAAFAVLLIFLASMRTDSKTGEPVLPVVTVQVMKGDLEKHLRVGGFIESESTVTVLPRISGRVTDISVEMGDPVTKDQVIATIDREPYELAWNQARAAFLASESTFKRISGLFATKSVSQQNYDEARAAYDAARAAFDLADLNLSYTMVKAPVAGVILEKHISTGAMAAPQVPLVTIGDLDNLQVSCGIPEIHYSSFDKKGAAMTVRIAVPAMGGAEFPGKIKNIAPYVSSDSRNFKVICTVKDEKKELRPGMYVHADFIVESRKDVFFLPYSALSGGLLWFIDDEGKARSVSFTPDFSNDDSFQVPDDWAGRRFIVKGQSFLENGRSVRIMGE